MNAEKITSAEQWHSLPGLDVPVIQSVEETGAIYEVVKLGYYPAAKEECVAIGLKADQPQSVAYVLPFAHVDFDGEIKMCRLPIELTSWALRALLITQRGANPLPARIEFGKVNEQVFADIL